MFMESPHDFDAVHWNPERAREIQSAAGPAHSKTWRKCARLWPTRQRLGVRQTSAAFTASGRPEFVRFTESPHGFAALHWDLEPGCGAQLVWCPAFRRSGPAKAGTPNRRFMERPESYLPTAVIYCRVLKNNAPSEIAGVAMQVSPSLLVATTENFPSARTT